MQRRPQLGLVIAALLAAVPAHAEPSRTLGVSADLVLPLDPWRDAVGAAGGGSIIVGIATSADVTISARIGAQVHATRTVALGSADADTRLTEVPLLGGARYLLRGGAIPVWLRGEVGLVFTRLDVESQGRRSADSSIVFGSRLGAGVGWDRFGLEASVWLADLSDLDHQIGVTLAATAELRRF